MSRNSEEQLGLQVHFVTSTEGQIILHRQGLTTAELKLAVALYQVAEQAHIGTWIGIHQQHGFFFSPNPRWCPDDPDAFSSVLGNVPWVQIHELLGKVPEGTTADYLDSTGNLN